MIGSGWSTGTIAIVLYPIALRAIIGGSIVGLLVTWTFARHIRQLMDQAAGTNLRDG